ncbi:MAG TPA: TraR/DksA C4-type zinc finger protein [Planctomycetota bacterium]|nr:TraR/DksA C4-type zinc finger protein [Planctomycetota bacterium]
MPLTPSERDQIRALLEGLREEFEPRVEQLVRSSSPVSLDDPIGRSSRMDAMQNQHMALAGLHRLQARLAGMQQALEQVDAPDFGLCEACGGVIGFDRLEFEPETTRCVRCAR